MSDPKWEKVSMPEKYVESKKYMSWERYFTDLLIEVTKDVPYRKYSKNKLLGFYRSESSIQKIKEQIKGLAL